MHDIVEELLRTVAIGGRAVPFAHMKYIEKSPLYIVYSFLAETPRVVADDVAEASAVSVDIDVYSKSRSNFSKTVEAVKAVFVNAGWSWAEDSPEMYDEGTKYMHITITFEKERSITWQTSD